MPEFCIASKPLAHHQKGKLVPADSLDNSYSQLRFLCHSTSAFTELHSMPAVNAGIYTIYNQALLMCHVMCPTECFFYIGGEEDAVMSLDPVQVPQVSQSVCHGGSPCFGFGLHQCHFLTEPPVSDVMSNKVRLPGKSSSILFAMCRE